MHSHGIKASIIIMISAGATKGWPSLDANEILSTPGATRRNITNEKARLWSYSPGLFFFWLDCMSFNLLMV